MQKSSRTRIFHLVTVFFISTFACQFSNPLVATPTLPPPLPSSTIPPTAEPTLLLTTSLSPTLEAIFIRQPGPNARIISPVLIEGFSVPTFEQNLIITVTDLNGAELALRPTIINAEIGQSGPFSLTVNFNLIAEIPGRISVFNVSPRDGGILHLSSVQVTLIAVGGEESALAPPTNEIIDILEPAFLAEISGGTLLVSGFSDYFFEANLGVVICGPGGVADPHIICGTTDNLISEGFATIATADIGLAGPFSGALAYAVTETFSARVVVYAVSPMDGAIIHLASQEITLSP